MCYVTLNTCYNFIADIGVSPSAFSELGDFDALQYIVIAFMCIAYYVSGAKSW